MSTLNPILIVDVNVLIHIEKAGLLKELVNDKNIRIVDLVFCEEYEYKKNLASKSVEKIKQIELNEDQVFEAHKLFEESPRNSIFDYYCYVAARDNNYSLLTGDWKLKKKIKDIPVHGAVWYVQRLKEKGIIDNKKLKEVYKIWLNDPRVYIDETLLKNLLNEIEKELVKE